MFVPNSLMGLQGQHHGHDHELSPFNFVIIRTNDVFYPIRAYATHLATIIFHQ